MFVPPLPAFVTTYEILRSQDYVMITFSTPTGEVRDGQMLTQEVQKLAFTYPRFVEFAAAVAQIERTIQLPQPAKRPSAPEPEPAQVAREKRSMDGERGEELRSGDAHDEITNRIVRH